MPINFMQSLADSKQECATQIAALDQEKLQLSHLTLQDFEQVLAARNNTIWWQIAAQALPVLLEWRTNRYQEKGDNLFLALTLRDIFLAYLKTAVLQRVTTSKKAPENIKNSLKTKVIDFLINLADMMTTSNIREISIKNMEGSAVRFFGDPWQGQNEKGLRYLELIREHAQDFIHCIDDKWKFVDDSYIEYFDSIVIVELTNIQSRLRLTMAPQEAQKESLNRFADILFNDPTGHYSLTKDMEWAAPNYKG